MTDNNTLALLGFIGAISSALTAWVASRKFDKTNGVLEEAYIKLSSRVTELEDERTRDYNEIKTLRAEITALHTELDAGRNETARLKSGIDRLIEQFRGLNIEPVWTPDKK